MTKKQIKKMLIYEGLWYAILTLLFVFSLGSAISFGFYDLWVNQRYMGNYMIFTYPWLPMIIVTVAVVFICMIIPIIFYHTQSKATNCRKIKRGRLSVTILKTQNLSKYYGKEPNVVRALDGIDLQIEEKNFVAIVGMSGSGKSTLLHMLGGLDQPTTGEIMIGEKNLSCMSDEELTLFRRQNVGFVFQHYNLVPVLSVYENIVLPIEFGDGAVDDNLVNQIITALGLEEKRDAFPNMLSGGQQQRVAIARALATKPSIVLADEPTGNLDSKTSGEVLELLQKVGNQFNQTIILITHNEKISELADRVIRIEDGKIKEDFLKHASM